MKIIGEEDKNKIIEGIATATLNSFVILMASCRRQSFTQFI